MSFHKEFRRLNKEGDFEQVITKYRETPQESRTELETKEYYTALKYSSITSLLTRGKSVKEIYAQIGNKESELDYEKTHPDYQKAHAVEQKNQNSGLLNQLYYGTLEKLLSFRISHILYMGLMIAICYQLYFKVVPGVKNDFKIESNSSFRFSDVKGIDEYREELEDMVDYLKNKNKYLDAGAKPTKGILLSGKPGTGKTLLAKAIAGEAGVNFIQTSGSAFEEMYVGVGVSRVRSLFELARASQPCIIFIDELDSIAQSRNYRVAAYSKDSLNQLLVEIDGFKPSENIFIIGATNYQESLDKAILRSGRFDKIIELPVPDRKARGEILDFYIGKIKTDHTIDRNALISKTMGMTGAEIENLVNLAALNAIKRGKNAAGWEDFDHALDRVIMGIEHKSLAADESDIQNTVYHELGHATVAYFTPGAKELYKITILPRGRSLGHTALIAENDDQIITKQEILAAIDLAMGGRAAEEVFFGSKNITTGCASDLKNATEYVYSGLKAGIFTELTGLKTFRDVEDLGKQQRNELDQFVVDILNKSYNRALELIKQKVSVIHVLAKELREKETLTKDQFVAIIENQ